MLSRVSRLVSSRVASIASAGAARPLATAAANQAECPTAAATPGKVVIIDYTDLMSDKNLDAEIEEAYGPEGLGLLTVRNIPNYPEARQALLPLASQFANLPDHIKEKMVHEKSMYNVGWSHGKERLEGVPDLAKGSYYANPQYDFATTDQAMIDKYPEYCHPNLWPKEDFPQLEPAFKRLGQLMVKVGSQIAKRCDNYVAKRWAGYEKGKLQRTIETSRVCRSRLLHYFPTPEHANDRDFSSWCGWHNDHGTLTALTCAMYINDAAGVEVANPDPTSGLYARNRAGQILKVNIPPDHLAFQIGESAQIHTGGLLQATPHCVRAAGGKDSVGISRNTFATFMQPDLHEPMSVPQGMDPALALTKDNALPKSVPPLSVRWNNQMTFEQFSAATLRAYY